MPTAFDVACHFLENQNEDAGELITNMKLQKLLYYAQGFHLAIFGRPLFSASVKAWAHGPVVPQVWKFYQDAGAKPIDPSETCRGSSERLTSDQRDLLNEIWSVYGQYSAWKLRDMTHNEAPWRDAFDKGELITHEAMRDYFKGRLA